MGRSMPQKFWIDTALRSPKLEFLSPNFYPRSKRSPIGDLDNQHELMTKGARLETIRSFQAMNGRLICRHTNRIDTHLTSGNCIVRGVSKGDRPLGIRQRPRRIDKPTTCRIEDDATASDHLLASRTVCKSHRFSLRGQLLIRRSNNDSLVAADSRCALGSLCSSWPWNPLDTNSGITFWPLRSGRSLGSNGSGRADSNSVVLIMVAILSCKTWTGYQHE